MIGTSLIILCVFGTAFAGKNFQYMTPGAKGRDVCEMVVKRIRDCNIFPDDNQFLRRIAYVESRFGALENTYRDGYYGGMWQCDKACFKATQNIELYPKLKVFHQKIKQEFGIDWRSMQWQDCQKPLYSGLAARLFLCTIPIPIPQSLEDQARCWNTYYNRSPKYTAQKFIDDCRKL